MIGDLLADAFRQMEHACLRRVVELSPSICDACSERNTCPVREMVVAQHGHRPPAELADLLAEACPKRRRR